VNASEEGDPIIHCVLKTEMVTQLVRVSQSTINVLVGPM